MIGRTAAGWAMLAAAIGAGWTVGASSEPGKTDADPPVEPVPEIRFEPRAFLDDQMKFVSQGLVNEACDQLSRHSRKINAERLEEMKRSLARIFGVGGPFHGHEIVGEIRIGKRLRRVYVLAHYEAGVILFSYVFELHEGAWKFTGLRFSDNLDELERNLPITPVE